jgi:hypothetical protein
MVQKIATVLRRQPEISMSPDRHGSGATRIEADLSSTEERKLMRRASTCLAVLALAAAALALPSLAAAAPTVTLKAVAVPIPKLGSGFPPTETGHWAGTGNIYGAGAAIEAEYKISGTEYGGFPPPVIGVDFWLPKGTKLHPAGFKTCPTALIEQQKEPEKCPIGSAAGPTGEVLGIVAFGKERVEESGTLNSFFEPGGGIGFFTKGVSPTLLEVPASGRYVGPNEGFGNELITKVPLVATVPGAPFASVKTIKIKVGAAFKQHGKLISYGTVPKKGQCPKGGFKIKSTMIFAENGEESKPEPVTVSYKAPCPRR